MIRWKVVSGWTVSWEGGWGSRTGRNGTRPVEPLRSHLWEAGVELWPPRGHLDFHCRCRRCCLGLRTTRFRTRGPVGVNSEVSPNRFEEDVNEWRRRAEAQSCSACAQHHTNPADKVTTRLLFTLFPRTLALSAGFRLFACWMHIQSMVGCCLQLLNTLRRPFGSGVMGPCERREKPKPNSVD